MRKFGSRRVAGDALPRELRCVSTPAIPLRSLGSFDSKGGHAYDSHSDGRRS